MFWPLLHGKVDAGGLTFTHERADTETLNARAERGDVDVIAVSIARYATIAKDWLLLPHGASIGRGYGPVVVAEQLPETSPTRKISLEYQAAYQKANNEPARGGFGPYAFDAWLIILDSAKRALATGAQPGTPEFRTALRDAIVTTNELVGTHAVYNFKPGTTAGVDDRAQVLVKLVDGKWKLMQ